MLPEQARTLIDKIVSEIQPGEKAPGPAFAAPRLRPYLPDRHALGRLLAGFGVILKATSRLLGKGLRLAFTPKAKAATEGGAKEEGADEEAQAKEPKTKVPAKKDTAADTLERLAIGGLCTLVTGSVATGAIATMGPRLLPYLPVATGIAVTGLLAAAWIAAPEKPPKQAAPAPSPELLIERDRRALYELLDEATARRNGVHIAELHQLTSVHPLFRDVPKENLTLLLDAFGVPWKRSLSVDGIGGRTGVRRTDVEALLQSPAPDLPGAPSRPTESVPDLRVHGGEERHSVPVSAPSRASIGAVSGGS